VRPDHLPLTRWCLLLPVSRNGESADFVRNIKADNTVRLSDSRPLAHRIAANPTLRNMILSLSVIGQERRTRSVEYMRLHPEVGLRRVQDHRNILAALRSRDPDLVE
jgi:hypothetical protein